MIQLNLRCEENEVAAWRLAACGNLSKWIRVALNAAAGGVEPVAERAETKPQKVRKKPKPSKPATALPVGLAAKEAPKYPAGFVPASAPVVAIGKTGKVSDPDLARHLHPQFKPAGKNSGKRD
jgi:hypothetical protein